MNKHLKKFLNPFRPHYIFIFEYFWKRKFESLLKSADPNNLKLVVGTSGIYENGWLPSEYCFLDLTKKANWQVYFKENTITNIMAEHVWEHMTLAEGTIAIQNCYTFLKPGGRLRIAIPDGYNTNEDYINYVKVGGYGAGADDHKVLYNYQLLSKIMQEAGFKVELCEYFDENGKFVSNDYNDNFGTINRSYKWINKPENAGNNYLTSLIVDAIK